MQETAGEANGHGLTRYRVTPLTITMLRTRDARASPLHEFAPVACHTCIRVLFPFIERPYWKTVPFLFPASRNRTDHRQIERIESRRALVVTLNKFSLIAPRHATLHAQLHTYRIRRILISPIETSSGENCCLRSHVNFPPSLCSLFNPLLLRSLVSLVNCFIVYNQSEEKRIV